MFIVSDFNFKEVGIICDICVYIQYVLYVFLITLLTNHCGVFAESIVIADKLVNSFSF